jgi:hypothetical protein
MMLEIEPSRFLGLELPADFDPESSSSSPTTSRETSA